MKSERRHELAENDLADSVENLAERMRPYLPTILIASIGSLLAVFLGLFISAGWEASRAESWDACLGALASGDENGFREVILRYPDSPAAQWAELVLADRNLSEATDLLFAPLDPANDVARQRLEDAAASYAGILAQRPEGMVAERAILGLAKARESLGELDEARRGYEALAQEYGESPMAGLAAAHAADLVRDDTKVFYNWFAEARVAAGKAAAAETPAENVPADSPAATEPADGSAATDPPAPVEQSRPAAAAPTEPAEPATPATEE
jgi:hypothetical protein